MGRKKKMTEAELENTQTTLTIEDSNQAESEEAELLAETDSEVVAEAPEQAEEEPLEASEATEEVIEKPRARRRRAKKEETTEETVTETLETIEATASEETLKKPRRSRSKKIENESTEVKPEVIATQSLDQWTAIKQLSESVAQILEQNQQLRMPPPNLSIDTDEFLKPQHQPSQSMFITKFAAAASIVAVLLSLVSLSLSQSARQAALGVMEPSKHSSLATTQKSSENINGGDEILTLRRSSRRR